MTDNKQNARKQAQRRARQRKQRNRRIALTACLMIAVMVASIGGTLAWLTDQTTPVVNTFTSSNIDITLTETGTTLTNGQQNKSFQMVPGKPIVKDPVVTVEGGSEKCWLFVKVEESANLSNYIDYKMADGWNLLNSTEKVYYRVVEASEINQSFNIIGYNVQNADDTTTFEANKVLVKNTVTKANMDALEEADTAEFPTLTFTAYAVQYYGFEDDAAGAWAQAQALQTTNP